MKLAAIILFSLLVACSVHKNSGQANSFKFSTEIREILKNHIMEEASWAMQQSQ